MIIILPKDFVNFCKLINFKMSFRPYPKTIPRKPRPPPPRLPKPTVKSKMTFIEYLEINKIPPKNPNRLLVPQFTDPVNDIKKFTKTLQKQKFVLESVTVSDPVDTFWKLTGTVRTLVLVPNIQVRAKYTIGKIFKENMDVVATEVESPFAYSRRFTFTIYLDAIIDVGNILSVVCSLQMPNGNKLWDFGEKSQSYRFDCLDSKIRNLRSSYQFNT